MSEQAGPQLSEEKGDSVVVEWDREETHRWTGLPGLGEPCSRTTSRPPPILPKLMILLRFEEAVPVAEFRFGRGWDHGQVGRFDDGDEPARDVETGATAAETAKRDLSEWQERHASLVLAGVEMVLEWTIDVFAAEVDKLPKGVGIVGIVNNSPCQTRKFFSSNLWSHLAVSVITILNAELAQLSYVLCRRQMKELLFWEIYFMLVRSHVAKYELRAIKLAKLIEMKNGGVKTSEGNGFELEMSESMSSTAQEPTL